MEHKLFTAAGFIMPFVKGESLRDRLARGPFSIPESINILREVAKGAELLREH